MKFALQDKLTGENNYMDMFKTAAKLGFDGVEITHFQGPLNEAEAEEIVKAAEVSGIAPTTVCGGYLNWIGDFDTTKRLEAVQGINTSLKHVARMGAQGLIAPAAYGMFSVCLPQRVIKRTAEADREALLDSMRRIAEAAEKYNVNLYLEPLNRYEDHMINTVAQAVSLIDEVGSKNIKAMGDFFHMSIEEDDLVETIEKYERYIGYYHLADSNRKQPGTGHTDFKTYLSKVKQLGYSGFLSLECGIKGERIDSLRETVALLKGLSE